MTLYWDGYWIWLDRPQPRLEKCPPAASECSLNKSSNITSALRTSTVTPLLATPGRCSASAVTIATPFWPAAWQCPLTPGEVTFGLRVIKGGGGGAEGQLLLEDSKSTSLIGYHLPFPYPHLCNWRIDQLDLCTLLAAPSPVYSGQSVVLEAGVRDVITSLLICFCKGVFVCVKQWWKYHQFSPPSLRLKETTDGGLLRFNFGGYLPGRRR